MEPLYITSDPEEWASKVKERLLALVRMDSKDVPIPGTAVSEEYAEAARQDILARARRVSGPLEANAIIMGRV